MLKVTPVSTPEELESALAIRDVVFIQEQGCTLDEERDEYDAVAHHVLAWLDGLPVGTARLLVKEDGVGKVGRVAALQEARGHGVGVALMRALDEKARDLGLRELVLDAQLQVIGFYQSLGYVAEGDVFEEARIMHRRMRRPL